MPDIALMGAVYPDVPAVTLPVDGGGTATFYDAVDGNNLEYGNSRRNEGVFYKITTRNFPSGQRAVGEFIYLKKSGNTYVPAALLGSLSNAIFHSGNGEDRCGYTSLPIPTLDGYYLGLILYSGGYAFPVDVSGGAERIEIQGYSSGYLITDDFSMTFDYNY